MDIKTPNVDVSKCFKSTKKKMLIQSIKILRLKIKKNVQKLCQNFTPN